MKNIFAKLAVIAFLAILPRLCLAVDAWPGGAGTTIATLSEPSGIVWHESRQSLFVVEDSGTLKEISAAGATLHTWPLAATWPLVGIPDLEGIAIAEDDRYLYIGNEHPDSIVEFDLETGEGALTGKYWDLTTWMTGADNSGLEGLAYRNGYFLAGLQADGKIYVFNVNLNVSGAVSHIETITPFAGYTDISGIDQNAVTGLTYSIFDGNNRLIELNAASAIVKHYELPGSAQEGIAIKTNCMSRKADVFITNDDTGIVTKYSDYPVTCLDADSDGVNYASDCNDYDAAISANQIYYRDADADGLGSDATTSVCSLTAPAGYVTNTNDANDSDSDNDGSPIGTDCNDADNAISQNQTYYRDIDGDGLGDANTTTAVCSLSMPEGYVADSSDPADLRSDGRMMYINGTNHEFFPANPTVVQYTDLNFFNDDWREIIAVGLAGKRAYIVAVKVRGSVATMTARKIIKKKYKSAQITTQLSKNKFTTRFNGKKKYIWRMKNTGKFNKSR